MQFESFGQVSSIYFAHRSMCTTRSEEIGCNDDFYLEPLNGGYVITRD